MNQRLKDIRTQIAAVLAVTAWLICDPDQPLEDIKGFRRWVSIVLTGAASLLL